MTAAVLDRPKLHSRTEWCYDTAFSRHRGIFTDQEQERLRESRVAIIGQGGVGGVHLMTLVRMGIGGFTIADPDEYEVANFNRQYGANIDTVGRPKAEVMAEMALSVNPQLDIRVLSEPVGPGNVDHFLDGADLLVDGVDFFAIDARRLVFAAARKRNMWAVTAGPHAFSTAWLTFDPQGMSFDEYFDLRDDMDEADKIVTFAVGCVPWPLHLAYLDLEEYFRPEKKAGASLALGCHLASGIVGAEAAKILLNRGDVRPAPCYAQFDAHRQLFKRGYLWRGNRHPRQLLKRWWFRRKLMSGQGNSAVEPS